MIRAFFRLLSMFALAVAVIMAVLDATRSIAAGVFMFTPLGATWLSASPSTIDQAEQLITRNVPAFLWDPILLSVLALPGFVVFAALALLFYAIGHKPERRTRGFVIEN